MLNEIVCVFIHNFTYIEKVIKCRGKKFTYPNCLKGRFINLDSSQTEKYRDKSGFRRQYFPTLLLVGAVDSGYALQAEGLGLNPVIELNLTRSDFLTSVSFLVGKSYFDSLKKLFISLPSVFLCFLFISIIHTFFLSYFLLQSWFKIMIKFGNDLYFV